MSNRLLELIQVISGGGIGKYIMTEAIEAGNFIW
jgi:hypothetical protein